ncbi:hypothetical protein EV421DRAFT_1748749, partial [Armillaria borealis]
GRSIPALVLENSGEKNLTSLDISTLTDDEKLDIIDVLGTFHRKGWVHGDIAERNILHSIDTNGRKKFRLCDLALAEQWECREDTRDETFNLFEILYPYDEEEEEDDDDDPVWKKPVTGPYMSKRRWDLPNPKKLIYQFNNINLFVPGLEPVQPLTETLQMSIQSVDPTHLQIPVALFTPRTANTVLVNSAQIQPLYSLH